MMGIDTFNRVRKNVRGLLPRAKPTDTPAEPGKPIAEHEGPFERTGTIKDLGYKQMGSHVLIGLDDAVVLVSWLANCVHLPEAVDGALKRLAAKVVEIDLPTTTATVANINRPQTERYTGQPSPGSKVRWPEGDPMGEEG